MSSCFCLRISNSGFLCNDRTECPEQNIGQRPIPAYPMTMGLRERRHSRQGSNNGKRLSYSESNMKDLRQIFDQDLKVAGNDRAPQTIDSQKLKYCTSRPNTTHHCPRSSISIIKYIFPKRRLFYQSSNPSLPAIFYCLNKTGGYTFRANYSL